MEKTYNHSISEKVAQKLWDTEKTYSLTHNPGPLYSIDTPPPTVSGALHIGHIFSYTQTDIIARYKRMQGFSVFYPFGFDDNGLATERFVEKKTGINAYTLKRSEFIALCLTETTLVEQQFKALWQQMGLSIDWNLCYSTIDCQTRKISQESFIRLFNQGHMYRRHEPALYCTLCRTSVAQAELDDAEKPSIFNDILFQTTDGSQVTIATTRPELLPACVAIFYNPSDVRYAHLKDSTALVPIFGNKVPFIADEAVLPEKGTGLVMCCTFGDKTDIHWFKKYNLPYKQALGLDGKFIPETGILAGLSVFHAREKIIAALQEAHLITHQKPISHSVNVHERCKKEIEYVMLSQWFLRILDSKEKFLALADEITWSPAFMKSRYKNWVENISWDWCLSRQRFYGIPFPVWYCTECDTINLATIDQLPVDPQETPFAGTCHQCNGTTFRPDTDVMDTWNTSSLTPELSYALFNPQAPSVFSQEAQKTFLPMSMRPQAHDIIRTWAFYTIIKAWFHHKSLPWRDIVISGHVLTDAKEKISKSKENNRVSPEHLLQTYPADAIRYWTASGKLGHDVAFSEGQLKIGLRLITKLWNAFRFIGEYISNAPQSTPEHRGVLNEWILDSLSHTVQTYNQQFALFEFGSALDAVETFFWNDFCDNYIELVKHQLCNPHEYTPEEVEATRWTLSQVGFTIIQLYAPYMPHITETVYQELYQKSMQTTSLHQTKLQNSTYSFAHSKQVMLTVIGAINQVRKIKTEHKLSLKTDIVQLTYYGNPEQLDILKTQEKLIKGIMHAHAVTYNLEVDHTPHFELTQNGIIMSLQISSHTSP